MSSRTLIWLTLFAFLFALWLRVLNTSQDTQNLTLRREQNTYLQFRKLIADRYVDPVDDKKLFLGALTGMAESLDRHTVFWTPDVYEYERSSTSGHFAGIGVEITWDEENGLKVITPLADTPAFEAGLMPGDRIVKINDQSAVQMSLEDASRLIRGPPDTQVMIAVIRGGSKEPLEFNITRAEIKIQSLQEPMILQPPESLSARIPADTPKIGYIRLVQFQEDSAEDMEVALLKLESEGMRGLILDLRQNPGGLLDAAVKISDLFVSEGVIVSTRGRIPGSKTEPEAVFRAQKGGTRPDYPMAILLDSGSASASEIVAGCLKDLKRAILIGEKSYGKGSVQTIIPIGLGDMGEGALKLTTAKYYTPSGISIDGKGIMPDYEVKFEPDQLRSLLLRRRKRQLANNDPRKQSDTIGTNPETAPAGDGKDADQAEPKKPFYDLQLDKAIMVLTDRIRLQTPSNPAAAPAEANK